MNLTFVFLAATAGALIGTLVGVLLMYRRLRLPISEADLALLKGRLQSAESSLATTAAALEDLRKRMAERDHAIRQAAEELKKRQEQIDLAAAEAGKEKTRRAIAEQRVEELTAQFAAMAEQRVELEARLQEERSLGATRNDQLALLEAERDAGQLQIQELTAQIASITADAAERSSQQAAFFEAQYDSDQQRLRDLAEQLARSTADAEELRRCWEQEVRDRSAAETLLGVEQERVRQLTDQIASLQREKSRFDVRLQEERQSAAKGMELLLAAHENLARVFKPLMDFQNGGNGNGSHEAAPASEVASDVPDELRSAASAD
jgi:chromosome segregation ATPase